MIGFAVRLSGNPDKEGFAKDDLYVGVLATTEDEAYSLASKFATADRSPVRSPIYRLPMHYIETYGLSREPKLLLNFAPPEGP